MNINFDITTPVQRYMKDDRFNLVGGFRWDNNTGKFWEEVVELCEDDVSWLLLHQRKDGYGRVSILTSFYVFF